MRHGVDDHLFRCGRAGRSMGANIPKISDEVVDVWLNGLPSSRGGREGQEVNHAMRTSPQWKTPSM
jgi:hypothetical protein